MFDLSKTTSAHIILIFVHLSFSFWHIIASLTLRNIDPFIFALTRELFSCIIFLYLTNRVFSFDFFQYNFLTSSERYSILLLGLFSFINVLAAVISLYFISPTVFAIFQTLIPIITTFFSIIFKYEILTQKKVASILLAVTGAVISIYYKASKGSSIEETIYFLPYFSISISSLSIGYFLLISQIFAMSMIILVSKPLLFKISPLLLTTYYYLLGTVITLVSFVFMCFFGFNNLVDIFQFFTVYDIKSKFSLMYCVFFATIFSYVMLQFANRELSPSISSVYCTVQPISTSILSYIFLSISITKEQLFGGILVFLGLFLALEFPVSKILNNLNSISSDKLNDAV